MTTPPNNGNSEYPEYPGQNPFGNNGNAGNNNSQGPQASQYPQSSQYPQYPSTPHPEDAPGYGNNSGRSQGSYPGHGYDVPQGYPGFGNRGAAGDPSMHGGYAADGYPPQPGFNNGVGDNLNPNMVNTDGTINVMRAVKWGIASTFSNAGVFIVGTFLTGLVMIAISGTLSLFAGANSASLGFTVVELLISLASAAWMIFVIRLMIWQVDKVKARYSDLFNGVHFWPGFIVSILASAIMSLIVAVPMAVWAGANAPALTDVNDPVAVEEFIANDFGSLLGVLGIILLIALLVYPLIMFPTEFATEGRAGIGGAFAGAFHVGKNNYGRLLAYSIIVSIVGGVIVVVTLGLGALVVAPATMLIRAHLYRQGAGGPIPHDAEHDGPIQGYGDGYGFDGYHGFA